MMQSLQYSYLALRLGLAAVFLWFGIDKFFDPQYWLDAWVPQSVIDFLGSIGLQGRDFIYSNGILEIFIGISLLSTLFIRFFSVVAVLFLLGVVSVHGLNEVLVRDLALIGAFIALIFWPDRRY